MSNLSPGALRRIGATAISLVTLAGCGQLPGSVTASPTAPADVTWLNSPSDASAFAKDRVLVKMRAGAAAMSVQDVRRISSLEGLGSTGLYAVPEGSSVSETLAKLRRDPNVAYAEPDYIYHATEYRAQATVNDPMFGQLWGIQKIQTSAAWDVTMGDPSVVVAVVDTGVDDTHPDLKGQVIKGWDFVNNDGDPKDDQGHGSHVAGTIAAIANNSTGVAGIAPKTRILAIKVLGSDGSGDTNAIAQGILKANALGAKIINLSLGGPQQSQTLKNALDTVTAKGTLCVVAAGNDGTSSPDYPAAYPNALSVGATDQSDKRTSFSNYGSTVDLAAPGLNILSTTEGTYKQESGTSMASPHVAGAAALLWAKNPSLTLQQVRDALSQNGDPTTGFSPALKRLNVAKALAAVSPGAGTDPAPAPTVSPAPTPDPVPTPPGESADTEAPSVPTGLKALPINSTSVELDWNAATDNVGVAGYRLYRDGSLIASTAQPGYTDRSLAAGTSHRYTVAAYDAASNVSAPSVEATVTMPASEGQLTLSGVTLKSAARTSATLSWSTNLSADSRIDYVPAATYGRGFWQTVQEASLVTGHTLTMTHLLPGTVYYLKITSTDANGNRITAGLYGLRTPN